MGPTVGSIDGYRYFLIIVDNHTRFSWAIMVKVKSEASVFIQQFYEIMKNQFNKSIKVIRTDNGIEFIRLLFMLQKE